MLVGAVLALQPALAAQDEAKADAATASASQPASAPVLTINHLGVLSGAAGAASGATGAESTNAASAPVGLSSNPPGQTTSDPAKLLVSAGGDLEVGVSADSYDSAVAWRARVKPDAELQLFLNGVGVAPAAKLYAQQRSVDVKTVLLRWHLTSGPATQAFWSSVYREHNLAEPSPLSVALGWSASGPNSQLAPGAGTLKVAVAPDYRQIVAVVVLVSLVVMMWYLIAATDAFRDSIPSWLDLARQWQPIYAAASPADQAAMLPRIDPNYNAALSQLAAARLYAGLSIGPPASFSDQAVAAGLLASGRRLPDAPYSLSRLQLGLWFMFAVSTGVFLWIVYGELPAISGSTLALLGISIGTAGASIASDPDDPSAPTNASRGLMTDIVTGFDQSHQVHRYQAVVVNLLLLAVGLQHVIAELSYPVFDNTWIGFLGVSGAALAAGKQLVEKGK